MSEETQKPVYKVPPSAFQVADFALKQYAITVRAGVPFDALKDNPSCWAHVAAKLAEGDIIHIRTEDRAYYARVYVLAVQKQAARVHPLEYVELPKGAVAPKEYLVEWGGRHKWRVVRAADKFVMEHGFGSEAEAAAHANSINAKLAA